MPSITFNLAYFRSAYQKRAESSIGDKIKTGDVFRNTHREPRVLTPKSEWAYVWNGISCTCCTFSTEDNNIHSCEKDDKVILEKIGKAKSLDQHYDLVFIKYEEKRHSDIDKLMKLPKSVLKQKSFCLHTGTIN